MNYLIQEKNQKKIKIIFLDKNLKRNMYTVQTESILLQSNLIYQRQLCKITNDFVSVQISIFEAKQNFVASAIKHKNILKYV